MADNLDTPYSRREIFYKGILDQDPDSLPDPETREERYLKAIAEAYPTPVEATVTQDEGSSTTSVMSQKAVTDALDGLRDSKLDKTGTAHFADNLTPYSADSGATQTIPFINQGTGCGNGESMVDTGSYAQVKKKLGNTICYNQLVNSDTTEVTIPSGRKYWARINGTDVGGTSDGTAVAVTGGTDKFCDLSLWYGSTGNIPSHLLSHPEDFGRYYSGSLAYNPGQLVNADGSVLTSIGRNIFDRTQTLTNGYLKDDGTITSTGTWKYTDYIAVSPNTAYYEPVTGSNPATCFYDRDKNFIRGLSHQNIADNLNNVYTTPPNAFYLRTSIAVANIDTYDISRYYAGESGYNQHYPYSVLAEVDTGSEALLGYDWKEPNGTIHRNTLPRIDMGTLAVSVYSAGYSIFRVDVSGRKFGRYNLMCSKYAVSTANAKDNLADKEIIGFEGENSYVYFRDTAYSGYTEAQIQAALSGVMLECESATPTTEQGTAFAENIPCDDFGSMYWTQTKGIPQGNEIFYPVDYKASLDTLLNMVDGDIEKLVTETELGAVADRIPEAPAEDGTYTLKATVADGVKTYAWVADE